jgi:hypothetical protein
MNGVHDGFSTLRESTYDEYVEWYLNRNLMKHPDSGPVPLSPDDRRTLMERVHGKGKLRPWFPYGTWTVVRIESAEALGHLMMLGSDWTRDARLVRDGVPRLLRNGVLHAIEVSYFEETGPKREEHHKYYRKMKDKSLRPSNFDKFVLCSLNADERKSVAATHPPVRYYLHDGVGRGLPYLTLVHRGVVDFEPIDAFLAIE